MLFGLDVASVDENKNANWQLAKAKGPISFAVVRATQSTWVDPQFAKSWVSLKAAGLVRGAYMFLNYPNLEKGVKKVASPEKQAQKFIDTVGDLGPTDLPPALDIEFPNGRTATGLRALEALDRARTAWNVLRNHYGAAPIIYTSRRVWNEDLNNIAAPDLVDSPLWLARYFWKTKRPAIRDAAVFADGKKNPPVPAPWGSAWAIHQYQGDAVDFPGFSSTVDVNRFNTLTSGSSGDLVKWAQRRLGIAESGKFDAAMAKKVVEFQHRRHLVGDGIIGPKTFAALCWG
jgi:lysozyme